MVDGLTQLAEALARQTFPSSGRYYSAGWAPAAALPDALFAAADAAGLDLEGAEPSPLASGLDPLDPFHVVVALDSGALERLGPLPYSTVFLQWIIAEGSTEARMRELASRVRDLMLALRGRDAA